MARVSHVHSMRNCLLHADVLARVRVHRGCNARAPRVQGTCMMHGNPPLSAEHDTRAATARRLDAPAAELLKFQSFGWFSTLALLVHQARRVPYRTVGYDMFTSVPPGVAYIISCIV